MVTLKSKKAKTLFTLLRIVIVVGVLVVAVNQIAPEWGKFADYFHRMNLGVFAVILLVFTVAHTIVGLRWWLLLRAQAIMIPFWVSVRLYFLGWFYNNFMPSSVGGDLIRAWYVTKHTEKGFEAALSVFVDRVIGLLSTLVIAICFFITLFSQGALEGVRYGLPAELGVQPDVVQSTNRQNILVIIVVIGACCIVLSSLLLFPRIRRNAIGWWSSISAGCSEAIYKTKKAVFLYRRKPGVLVSVFGLTVIMQLMVITGFWVLAENMGISVSLMHFYAFFTIAWVIGAVPISIGGFGLVEGALILLFTEVAKIEGSAAWAIAFSQRAVWMITSLPGAGIHLFGAHLPKDFSVDYDHSIN